MLIYVKKSIKFTSDFTNNLKNPMKKSLMTLVLIIAGASVLWAQKTVSGVLRSADDGQTLPGVSIVEKGTANGTTTDLDGKYTLTVKDANSVLVFSFMGMTPQEVTVGTQTTVSPKLKEDATKLAEVEVTALGIPREKKSLGYASQTIKSDDITSAREMNTVNAMQGKVAGLNITSSSGGVGASSNIVLRGPTSFTGNNAPLFIINGIPVDNSFRASRDGSPNYGNPISDINPDDIESINILKGPVAAALYGSKAMNGAIIVTTKSGKGAVAGTGLKVTYSASCAFDKPLRLPELQNKYGQGYTGYDPSDGSGDFMYADESWGAPLDGRNYVNYLGQNDTWDAQPDNIKNFFETGHQCENALSVESADDKGTVRFSFSSFNQKGTVPNTAYNKYNGGLNITRNLTSKLSTEINVNYTLSQGKNRPGVGYDSYNPLQSLFGWFGRQVDMQMLKDNYDAIDPNTGLHYNWNPVFHNNPYWTLYNNINKDRRDRVISTIKLNYKISEWLSASVRGGSDYYVEDRFQQFKKGTIDYSFMQNGGFYDDRTKQNTSNFDALLIANKKLNEDFSITATIGYNYYRNVFDRTNTEVRGLIVPDLYNVAYAANAPILSAVKTTKENVGVYGLGSIGYKNMIYLDITGRNDWSSTLPSNNRSYFYPSISGSFIFSELLKDKKWLSFGKFRAGLAFVGNDADPYSMSSYKQKVEIGSDPSIIGNPFNGAVYLTEENILRNDQLKPETGKSFEIGTEMRFFNNRLGIDVTYYNTTTQDIIVPVSIAASSGYSSMLVNAGKINNQGIELMLTATPIKKENYSWNTSINFGKNKGLIMEVAEGLDKIYLDGGWADLYLVEGESYGTLYGRGALKDENGKYLINPNTGRIIKDPNPQSMGNVTPDFRLGFNNSFTYKNITFDFLIDWQQGGKVFSETNMWMDYSGLSLRTEDRPGEGLVNDGVYADNSTGVWVSTGVTDTTHIDVETYWADHAYNDFSNSVYDATYVKLRQVSLTYEIPKSLVEKTPFSSMSFGVYGRNLWIIYSKLPYMDPEVNSANSRNAYGFESNAIPSSRSLGFNLKIVF